MTSSLPGVKYRAAHYKNLEQDKTNAPKISKGCYDAMMILSPQLITDGQWWYNKLNCSKTNITKSEPVIEVSSDASSTVFTLEEHSTLKKWNTTLMLSNLWQQIFPLKHL